MKLFMDNVPNLAIQIPIVREIPDMFCVNAVRSMKADLIIQIAGDLGHSICFVRFVELEYALLLFNETSVMPR